MRYVNRSQNPGERSKVDPRFQKLIGGAPNQAIPRPPNKNEEQKKNEQLPQIPQKKNSDEVASSVFGNLQQ